MKETLRTAALAVQSRFNEFDRAGLGSDCSDLLRSLRPTFIIGAPRTGSTLLYQLMVQQLNFAYISNLLAAFPKYMVRLSRAFPTFFSNPPNTLHPGYFGFVPGLRAPSEAGKIFDKWFLPDDLHRNKAAIRDTIAALTSLHQAPFLAKSLTIGVRIKDLLRVFPEVRLIHVRRNPLFVAQSILMARQSLGIGHGSWWSVKVPGWEDVLCESPVYQAAWQVTAIERLLVNEFGLLNITPSVVEYEDLCTNPRDVMVRLRADMNSEFRSSRPELPMHLKASDCVQVDERSWLQLEEAFSALEKENAVT